YFPHDLFSLQPDEVFVDCGTFDGDTIEEFIARAGVFERIYGFEPDPFNWSALKARVSRLPAAERILLFNKAVGMSTGVALMNACGTIGSSVGNGTVPVEVVALDEVLDAPAPTFLKFDIEGAELEALAGTRRTLAKHSPIVAVCLYHVQDHLWRIPLMISSTCEDYRFFLRCYATDGWELVGYAIPPGRLRSRSVSTADPIRRRNHESD